MDSATVSSPLVADLAKAFEPYSKMYGSGSVESDLLFCAVLLAIVLVVIAAKVLLKRPPVESCAAANSEFDGDPVAIYLAELRDELKKSNDRSKADAGYLRQELAELHSLVSSLAYQVQRREERNDILFPAQKAHVHAEPPQKAEIHCAVAGRK